jgi:hypothetical protein
MKVYEPLCWIWDNYSASTIDIEEMGLYSTIELAVEKIDSFYKERLLPSEKILKLKEGMKVKADDKYNLSVVTKKYEFHFRVIERELFIE